MRAADFTDDESRERELAGRSVGIGEPRLSSEATGHFMYTEPRGCPVQAPLGRGCSFVTNAHSGVKADWLRALGTQALSRISSASFSDLQLLSPQAEAENHRGMLPVLGGAIATASNAVIMSCGQDAISLTVPHPPEHSPWSLAPPPLPAFHPRGSISFLSPPS